MIDKRSDKEEWEKDITLFLMLCSKKDALFLSIPECERKGEDYVRLMMIALVFGFRCAFMRILGEAERCHADIMGIVAEAVRDYDRVSGWIEEFVEAIPDKEVRELVQKEWERKRAAVDEKNFHFSQLLGEREKH